MAIPRIPRRWRLQTLMIVVAFIAVGLGAYRVWVERGPVYRLIGQLRSGNAKARSGAALRIGLLGPRAAFAIKGAGLGPGRSRSRCPGQRHVFPGPARLAVAAPAAYPGRADRGIPKPEPGRLRMPETAFIDLPRGWAKSDGDLSYNDPIKALEMIRPDATAFVPLLGKAMKSPHYWVREAAIEAILAVATWSSPSRAELAGALLEVLTDDRLEPDTREVEALNRFTDRNRAAVALAKLDPPAQESAAEQLAGDLYDLGSLRSYEAALLLHHLGARPATVGTTLQGFIRDGDEARRRIAMTFLGPFAGPAEAPAVLRAITRRRRPKDRPARPTALEGVARPAGGGPGIPAVRPGDTATPDVAHRARRPSVEGDGRTGRASGHRPVDRDGPGAGCRPPSSLLRDHRPGRVRPRRYRGNPGPGRGDRATRRPFAGRRGLAAASDSSGVLATLAIGSIAAEGNADAIAVLARLVADPGASVALHGVVDARRAGSECENGGAGAGEGTEGPAKSVRVHSAMASGRSAARTSAPSCRP